MQKNNVYSYFDDIVCISLDIAPERQKHAEYYFNKLNIPARFFVAKKHPNGGVYGCFDSHIRILQDAYNRGLDNILVFEDDVMPTDSYSEDLLGKAIEFMNINNDWDIFYLGCTHPMILIAPSVNLNVIHYSPILTHALCYSRKAIYKILSNYKNYIGIYAYDWYLKTMQMNNYCIIPILFEQNYELQYSIENKTFNIDIIRALYPIALYSKFTYRLSLIKYYSNLLFFNHDNIFWVIYICLILIIIVLYTYHLHNQKYINIE